MSQITALDIKKVESLYTSLAETERVIIAGSDEHLDLILHVQDCFKRTTTVLSELVDNIENHFNNCDADMAKIIVVKVFPFFEMSKSLIKNVKNAPIFNDVKRYVEDFELEVEELFEITNDLARYKVEPEEDAASYF